MHCVLSTLKNASHAVGFFFFLIFFTPCNSVAWLLLQSPSPWQENQERGATLTESALEHKFVVATVKTMHDTFKHISHKRSY